jgi:GNAT superfamily N-acetyltransferase
MPVDKERFTARGNGFTVRPARPEDLAAVRALVFGVLERDLGYGYNPEWHADLDNAQAVYIDHPRHALWVAVNDATGEVVGTGGVRSGGPKSPPHEQWLADRYAGDTTAQVVRVYTTHSHRRRGTGRTIVEQIRRFVAAEGGYTVICFHTNALAPGAEAFWRAMPTTFIHNARGIDPFGETLHFELRFPEGS